MASTKDCLEFILEQFRSERLSEVTTRHQLDGIQRMFAKIIKSMMDGEKIPKEN